jgi:hypothetical protein
MGRCSEREKSILDDIIEEGSRMGQNIDFNQSFKKVAVIIHMY